MSIREFQQRIADAINTVEALVQGGCKAVAEDTLSVVSDVETQLSQAAGVAIVVTTPSFTRDGCAADKIPASGQLKVQCIEIVAANREVPGHLTALDAAQIVAQSLDSGTFHFLSIDQTADNRAGTVMAAVTFNTAINL